MTTEFRVKHGMTMVKIQWIEIISRKGQKETNKLTNDKLTKKLINL